MSSRIGLSLPARFHNSMVYGRSTAVKIDKWIKANHGVTATKKPPAKVVRDDKKIENKISTPLRNM